MNSLKCFEASGRLLSFTRAAEELNVTQAAISHQIKIIEEYVRAPLFIRSGRQLTLTRQGEQLLPQVTAALDNVADTLENIRQRDDRQVRVRLAPTFAAKWLSTKLKDFRQYHPDIDLVFFHSQTIADFSRDDLDLAIVYGAGDWSGVSADRLLSLDFFPVCSPDFLDTDKPISLENLGYYTLLHNNDPQNWRLWLELAEVELNADRGIIMEDTNVLIRAAIDGQGVALASSIFVIDELANGQLVKPFDIALQSESAYHVVYPEHHLHHPATLAFRNWLLEISERD